jgi:glycosyltransferase involved in cell wall biosynthesis
MSVVIATYKRPERLLRAVHCVLAQTVSDLELIVVCERDDGASVEALATVADPRVRTLINPVKAGPGVARDLGARTAAGRWVAFLDDDDEWLPAKLERQLAVADDDTIVMTLSNVVTPAGIFVRPGRPYAGDEPIDEWLFARRSWFRGGESMLQTSSLMMPTRLFDQLGFGAVRHEEWELVIRAVKLHGYQLVTVREPLVNYYTGSVYPWYPSVEWVETMVGVLSPRAISGFCLNVATQGVSSADRNKAFYTFAKTAFSLGRPDARQMFAFALIWVVPDTLRERIRALLRSRR